MALDNLDDAIRDLAAAEDRVSRLPASARIRPLCCEEVLGLAYLPGQRVLDKHSGQEGVILGGQKASINVRHTRGEGG